MYLEDVRQRDVRCKNRLNLKYLINLRLYVIFSTIHTTSHYLLLALIAILTQNTGVHQL